MPVTTPPAEAGGFPVQLRGNPPADAPKAVSRPETEGLVMHDHRRRHVAIQHAPAGAGVYSGRERLGLERPALGAGLARSARIDQHDLGTATPSHVPDELDEEGPRGVVNGPGEHAFLQPGQVEVFERDAPVARHEGARELVQAIAALASHLRRSGRQSGLGLQATPAAPPASQADPAATVGFDALLQAGIVQTEEIAQHFVKHLCLYFARPEPVFVAADGRAMIVGQYPCLASLTSRLARIPPPSEGDGSLPR